MEQSRHDFNVKFDSYVVTLNIYMYLKFIRCCTSVKETIFNETPNNIDIKNDSGHDLQQ